MSDGHLFIIEREYIVEQEPSSILGCIFLILILSIGTYELPLTADILGVFDFYIFINNQSQNYFLIQQ